MSAEIKLNPRGGICVRKKVFKFACAGIRCGCGCRGVCVMSGVITITGNNGGGVGDGGVGLGADHPQPHI